jgi:hypothetical protein
MCWELASVASSTSQWLHGSPLLCRRWSARCFGGEWGGTSTGENHAPNLAWEGDGSVYAPFSSWRRRHCSLISLYLSCFRGKPQPRVSWFGQWWHSWLHSPPWEHCFCEQLLNGGATRSVRSYIELCFEDGTGFDGGDGFWSERMRRSVTPVMCTYFTIGWLSDALGALFYAGALVSVFWAYGYSTVHPFRHISLPHCRVCRCSVLASGFTM